MLSTYSGKKKNVMPSNGTFQTYHLAELWHNLAASMVGRFRRLPPASRLASGKSFPEEESHTERGFDWRLTFTDVTHSEIILRESCNVSSFLISTQYTVVRGSDLPPAYLLSFHSLPESMHEPCWTSFLGQTTFYFSLRSLPCSSFCLNPCFLPLFLLSQLTPSH